MFYCFLHHSFLSNHFISTFSSLIYWILYHFIWFNLNILFYYFSTYFIIFVYVEILNCLIVNLHLCISLKGSKNKLMISLLSLLIMIILQTCCTQTWWFYYYFPEPNMWAAAATVDSSGFTMESHHHHRRRRPRVLVEWKIEIVIFWQYAHSDDHKVKTLLLFPLCWFNELFSGFH